MILHTGLCILFVIARLFITARFIPRSPLLFLTLFFFLFLFFIGLGLGVGALSSVMLSSSSLTSSFTGDFGLA